MHAGPGAPKPPLHAGTAHGQSLPTPSPARGNPAPHPLLLPLLPWHSDGTRCRQPGNGTRRQCHRSTAASTLPPPRDKRHAEAQGDAAGEAPAACGSPPQPGSRYLEAQEHRRTLPFPPADRQRAVSLLYSHSSTCSEPSQVPRRFPHASARSPSRGPWEQREPNPLWGSGAPHLAYPPLTGPSGRCSSTGLALHIYPSVPTQRPLQGQ